MAKMTMHQAFVAALTARGETLVKHTAKYAVYTRKAGGYYYVGMAGGLRVGSTVSGSLPASGMFKHDLMLEARE